MAAIISGNTLGLFNNPLSPSGQSLVGRGGQSDSVFINSATGNLVIQGQDEYLASIGLDLSLIRTYNSQGQLTDDNGDNWRLGVHQRVYDVTGTLNAAGSMVRKTFGDGADILYTYDTAQGLYISTAGDGAHDTLGFDAGTQQWTWTDGSSRHTETYNNSGQLIAVTDAGGNTTSYIYTGLLLTQITDAAGQVTHFGYTGNNLTQIRTVSNGQTQTKVRYTYDQDRLSQVIVDLSSDDNSITDGNTYTTTYTYDGQSTRITSITNGDGSSIAFAYELVNGQYRVSSYTDGEGRVTNVTYQTVTTGGTPTSAPAAGLSTTITYPRTGQLSGGTPGAFLQGGDPQHLVVMEAEHYDQSIARGGAQWQAVSRADFEGGSGVEALPNSGVTVVDPNYINTAAQLDYRINFTQTGAHNVFVRVSVPSSSDNSVFWGIDGQAIGMATDDVATLAWWNIGSINIATTGIHTLNFWMREDGFQIDRIAISSDPAFRPANVTLTESARQSGSGAYYVVEANQTWNDIALALYGTTAVADELQALYPNVTLAAGVELADPPANLDDNDATPYYTVQANDTWASITEDVYNTTDPNAVAALSSQFPGVTLTAGFRLNLPGTLNYATGGTSALQANVTIAGLTTSYLTDSAGRLIETLAPAINGVRARTQYYYDATGNVDRIIDPNGNETAMAYDARGNLLLTRDALGNTVTRTYSNTNQLLSETVYTVADPDGAGSGQPNGALTTQYVYDSENHLRFTITAEGRVTEHRYNSEGNRTSTHRYTTNAYSGTSFSESDLSTWATSQATTTIERTDYAYDVRGNVTSATAYGATDASGNGVTGSGSVTRFIYDQRGQLLQTIDGRGEATADPNDYVTTYTYDGLGRVLATTQWVSSGVTRTSLNTYDDANRRTTVTLQNGLATTSTYDRSGLLIAVSQTNTQSDSNPANDVALGATTYVYDGNGRLRITTDPTGIRNYFFYDEEGRQIATVDAAGSLNEVVYDSAGNAIKTIRYAVRVSAAQLASLTETNGNPTAVTLADLRPIEDPNKRITHTIYDSANRAVLAIEAHDTDTALGYVTRTIYDGAGRVTDVIRYATAITVPATPTVDNVTPIENANLDRRTRSFYDNDGNLRGTLDAEGYVCEYVYDAAGRLTDTIHYAASATVYSAPNVIDTSATQTLRTSGDFIALRNNILGQGASSNDQRTYTFYNGKGQVIAVLDAEGYLTEYAYDSAGNRTEELRYYERARTPYASNQSLANLRPLNLAARATVTAYNGVNQITQVTTNPDGTITRYTYDALGNLIQTDSAANTSEVRTTRARYDVQGRVIQELTGEGSAALDALYQSTSASAPANSGALSTTSPYNLNTGALSGGGTGAFMQGTTPEHLVVMEAEHFDQSIARSGAQWEVVSGAGFEGGSGVRANPNSGNTVVDPNYPTVAPQLDYRINFNQTGTHYVFVRVNLTSSADNTIYWGLDGQGLGMYGDDPNGLVWWNFGPINITSTGIHTLNFWMREDGFEIDRIAISTDSAFRPQNVASLPESARESGTGAYYVIQSGDTWASIANTLYGTPNLGPELEAALGNPTLTPGNHLTNLPATLNDTVAPYYTVLATDTWATITNTVYGTTDANAVAALQAAFGNPSLSAGLRLTMPGTLEYTTGASPTQTQIDAVWEQWGITHAYDVAGRRTSTTDQNGNRTLFYYDAARRLTHTVNALGEVAETRYNAFGGVDETIRYTARISTADLTGGLDTSALTDRLNAITANDRSRTDINYTLRGAVREAIDELNRTTRYTYTRFGELDTRLDPIKTDVAANDPSFRATLTRYTYDKRGLTTERLEDADNGAYVGINRTTTSTYDAFGRIVRSTDGNGNATTYDYDRLGRQVEVTDAAGERVTTYDAFSRVLTQRDRLNNVTTYTYNDTDRSFTLSTQEGIRTITRRNHHGETVEIELQEANGARVRLTRFEFDRNGNLMREVTDPTTGGLNLETRYEYDRANRRVLTRNANGTYTRFDYDVANRLLTRTVDPRSIRSNNDNPNGLDLTTSYQHDGQGRTFRTIDGLGTVTETTHDAKGQVTSVVVDPITAENSNGLNLRTDYTYDEQGRTLTVTEGVGRPEARTTHYTYDNLGRRIEERLDPNGLNRITTYVYDANDNLVAKTEAQGLPEARTTRYVYDASNRLRYTIDALGGVVENLYDAEGRSTSTVRYAQPLANVGSFAQSVSLSTLEALIDDTATSISRTDANNQVTHSVYDRDGRLVFALDGLRYLTEYEYDAAGRVLRETRHAGALPQTVVATVAAIRNALPLPNATANRTTHTVYDAAGRLQRAIDPLGKVTETIYEGLLTRIIEAAGTSQARETRRYHDRAGRVIEETIAYGVSEAITQRFGYDSLGNQTILIDPRGVELAERSTAWAQAERARLGYAIDAAALTDLQRNELRGRYTSTQIFDRAGRKTSETDALGNTTSTIYDALGNIVKVTDPRGAIGYFYNGANGKVRFHVDPMGYVTEYRYDAYDQITDEIRYARALTGAYNENTTLGDIEQRVVALTDAQDRRTTKTYDARGSVREIRYYGTGVIYTEQFEYDAFGNKRQYKDKNNAIFNYEYNARGQLIRERSPEIEVVTAVLPNVVTETVRLAKAYEYDAFGNRIRIIDAEGLPQQRETRIEYDALGRETRIEDPAVAVFDRATGVTTTVTPVSENTFDVTGNLVMEGGPGASRRLYYYDRLNRLIASVDADNVLREYEYDAVGNLVRERTYGARLTGDLTWTQRPAPFNPDDYREMRYRYNANNLRIGTETRAETLFSFELLQSTGQGYYESPVRTATDYDANGQIVRTIDGNGNATYQFYDARGNRILQVDPLGYVIQWEYGAQGEVERETKYATALSVEVLASVTVNSDPLAILASLPEVEIAEDRVTEYDYDQLGRLTTERKLGVAYATVNANNGELAEHNGDIETRYEYDGNGNRTAQVQPGAQGRIDFHYDAFGRQTAVLSPAFQAFVDRSQPLVTTREETRFAYDAHSNLVVQTQLGHVAAENRERRAQYDNAGRLRTEVDPEGATIAYEYDVRGNVVRRSRTVTDVDGVDHIYRTYYTYDRLDRETSRQDIEDENTAREVIRETEDTRYNAHGDIEAKGVNGQFQEQYRYDRLGRVFWTNKDNGTPRLYLYDANGNAVVEIHAIDTDLTVVNGSNGPIPVTSPAQIRLFSPVDVQFTFNRYDERNQLTDTFESPMEYGDLVSTTSIAATSGTRAFPSETLTDLTQYQAVNTDQMTPVGSETRSVSPTTTILSDVNGTTYGFGSLPQDVHTAEYIDVPLSELGLQVGTTTIVQPPVVDPLTEEISNDGLVRTVTERVTKVTIVTDVTVQPDRSVNKRVTTTTDVIMRETVFQRQLTQVFGANEQSLEEQWIVVKTEEISVDRIVNIKEDRVVRERFVDAVASYVGVAGSFPGSVTISPATSSAISHRYGFPDGFYMEWVTATVPLVAAYGDGPVRIEVLNNTGGVFGFQEFFGSGTAEFRIGPVWIPADTPNLPALRVVRILKGGNVISATDITNNGDYTADVPAFVSVKGQHPNSTTVQLRLLDSNGAAASGFILPSSSFTSDAGIEFVFQGPYTSGQRYEYMVYDGTGNLLNHVQGSFGGVHENRYQLMSRQLVQQVDQPLTDTVNNYRYLETAESRLQNNYLRRLALSLTESESDEKIAHRFQIYNAFGQAIAEIDGNGNRTDFAYNDLGKLVRMQEAETDVYPEEGASIRRRPTTYYFYDQLGQLVGTQDPNNADLTGSDKYSATRVLVNGRVEAEFDAFRNVTRYRYDRLGNRRQQINAVGLETEYRYDRNGRLIRTNSYDDQGSLHSYDSYEYDYAGNRIGHTNALGYRETYLFDGENRIRRHRSFAGRETQYDYSYLASIGGMGGYEQRTVTAGTTGEDVAIDRIDYFGKIRYHRDLGGHEFNYFYNTAGWLSEQTATTDVSGQRNAQRILYGYYQNGFLRSVDDLGISSYARFQYDHNGNRILEAYSQVPIGAGEQQFHPYQVASAEYDELNRVRRVQEAGKFDIRYTYDANGNRRSVRSTYFDLLTNTTQQQDFYYAYDRMNRFLITMGQRDSTDRDQDGNTQEIVRDTTGFGIGYDALGRRANVYSDHVDANGQVQSFRDSYTYDPINTVSETRIYSASGALVARTLRENDAIGNLRHYREFDASSSQTRYTYYEYDPDSLRTLELDDTTTFGERNRSRYNYLGNGILTSTIADTIDAYGQQVANSAVVALNYNYERWDAYKESAVTISATAAGVDDWRPGTSTYRYDANGHIVQLYDSQADRTLNYVNNHNGQALKRYQIDHELFASDRPPVIRRFYFLNGVAIGDVGNDNVLSRVDYAQMLASRDRELGTLVETFEVDPQGGNAYITRPLVMNRERRRAHPDIGDRIFPVTSADFDQNYQPINAIYPPHAPQSRIVKAGDTLQSIARAMWGDASLWYLLADANGLTGDQPLVAGTRLTVPNVVTNVHNNAEVFRPYDPGLALGDTTPTLPDPPPPPADKGCGTLGTIIVMIVVIVVAYYTGIYLGDTLGWVSWAAAAGGAAAGSVAGQLTGMALGVQDKFSWKAVAVAALSAGVTQGALGSESSGYTALGNQLGTVGRAAFSSIVSQGANMLFGQQKRFSWSSVAVAALSAPANEAIDENFGTGNSQLQHGFANPQATAQPFTLANLGNSIVGEFLKATTRQAVSIIVNRGGEINWKSGAVDAFGNGIGNSIVGAVKYSAEQEKLKSQPIPQNRTPDAVDPTRNGDPNKIINPGHPGTYRVEKVRGEWIVTGATELVETDKAAINGILNPPGYAAWLMGQHVDAEFGNDVDRFTLFYNPTESFLADGWETLRDKLGFTTDVAKQFSNVLQQTQASGRQVEWVAHSQGGAIFSEAVRVSNTDLSNNSVVFHSGANNEWVTNNIIEYAGVRAIGYRNHPFDPVPNIVGFNALNPIKLLGSVLALPAVILGGPELSPHTLPYVKKPVGE